VNCHDEMIRVLIDDRRRELGAIARRSPRVPSPDVPLQVRPMTASTPLRVRAAALRERLMSSDARSFARRWASRSPT